MKTPFGPFELNEATRELRLHGKVLELQPRIFDVLAYLIRHRDRVVGKEELLNTLWPDVIVTDASLQRAISLIRSTLKKGGYDGAIQTHSRLGYRFSIEATEAHTEGTRIDVDPPAPVLPDNHVLEREPFLEELNRRLKAALGGIGQAVFVGGEAGIGKSTLVTAFLERSQGDAAVYSGYCDALFTPRPLGAVLDLVSHLPDLARTALTPDLPREILFAELLQGLGRVRPGAIIVLEDLHWADEATLDFVRYFGRRITRTRCLLLATYRDEESGESQLLGRTLGELIGAHVSRQRLKPLSATAVSTLASEAGQDGNRIFNVTGGNPFLVRELLSSPSAEVPETVRDSMLARLSRCSSAARQVCEVVALLPGRAELDLVTDILGDAAAAIDETVARGIMVPTGGALSYRHELARRAVENVLAPAHSRSLHAKILTALDQRKSDVARQVHHARCAGDRAAVLRLAPIAAKRAAALGAHRESVAQFATALAFADELPLGERAELHEQYAYENYLTNRLPTAVEAATTALRLRREQGDRLAEGRGLRLLSRLYWFSGDGEKAERFAGEAIALLERLPPGRDLAMAYSNRAQLGMLKSETAIAIEYGERAVRLAREVKDVEVEIHALNNLGAARLNTSDVQGAPQLERSLQLALAHNFQEHVARAYVNLCTGAMRQQNMSMAQRYLAEGLAYCEERDLDSWTNYLKAYQARSELDSGRWDHAFTVATAVVENTNTPPITRIPALVVRAQVHARRGLPGYEAWLEQARELALVTREQQRIGPVTVARCEAAWLKGDTESLLAESEFGLTWIMESHPWLSGELLFWRSQVKPIDGVPPWLPRPYKAALEADWRTAAEGFAQQDMPYERALQLARGDTAAASEGRQILEKLGATATLAALTRDQSRLRRR